MRYALLARTARSVTIGTMAIAAAAACTMKSQEAPPLTGPSDFAQSITVGASPDVLSQDGASQSVITVTARGPAGEPIANLSMNAEIRVNGARVDFGSLSARHLVTGGDGRSTFVYTAPPSPALSVRESTDVSIVVTPIGTDVANGSERMTTIRVIPVGLVVPPDGLAPYFSFSPAAPQESQEVLFTACNDPARPCAPEDNPIAEYNWNFGDGRRGSGKFDTHAYQVAGSYAVTLTVEDQYGRSATAVQQITVGASANPTASFVFSPDAPGVGQTIAFNASASTAAAGREIESYVWDFGDGTGPRAGGVTFNYAYSAAGTYNVTLVVTDDAGKKGTITVGVTITP